MTAWVEVAQFTLTKDWQFTSATAGRFFRVRHIQGRRVFSGWIGQADISNPALPTIAEVRGLFCKEQSDLYEFPSPTAFNSRAIGVKRLDDSLVPWVLAVDVLNFDVGENPNIYQKFSGAAAALMTLLQDQGLAGIAGAIAAHEAANDPHPEYLSVIELALALDDKVTDAELADAVADKVTDAELADAVADKVTDAELAAALAATQETTTLTVTTTGNILTEIVTPQRVIIHANATAGYEIFLTGHRMNSSTPEFIYWLGSGCITRGAGAANTILQSAVGSRRSSGGSGANWTPLVSADTINGALKIQVKGDPNKTIKWVAKVKLTEVW